MAATTTLRGVSGTAYVFEEVIEGAAMASTAGIFMLTRILAPYPVATLMGPKIGYAVNLDRELWGLVGRNRHAVVHTSNVLVHPVANPAALSTIWKDLLASGADPLPSFA